MNLIKSKNGEIMNFKVSVIVPVYNVEDYIERCLLSLVNQTLNEIEIVVVNDGSPDNSQEIVEVFQKQYPEKIFSFIKENGGLSDARNFGISKARGDYIAFVDSDDYVHLNMYKSLYEKAELEQSDIVASNFFMVYGEEIKENIKIQNELGYNTTIANNPELLLTNSVYAWNKLYKKSFLEVTNFKFPKGQVFEDSAVIYNLSHQATKISGDSNCYYYYIVQREGSITATVNRKMFDVLKSCNQIYSYFKDFIYEDNELYSVIEYISLNHLLARMRAFVRSTEKKLSIEFMKEMYKFLEQKFPNWRRNSYFVDRFKSRKRFAFLVKHKYLFRMYLSIDKSWRKKLRNSKNFILGKRSKNSLA